MIYPTRRAVMAMALGAPVALLAGAVSAELWLVGPAWLALVLLAAAADAGLGGSRAALALDQPDPVHAEVARPDTAAFVARFARGRIPQEAEAALTAGRRLGLADRAVAAELDGREARFAFPFTPERRGEAGGSRRTAGPQKRVQPRAQRVREGSKRITLRARLR